MQDLKKIEQSALRQAGRAQTREDLTSLRAEVLGKKGSLGAVLRGLSKLAAAERPKAGQAINKVKHKIETALTEATERVERERRQHELEAGRFDVTLPGRRRMVGSPHPLRLVEQDVVRALSRLGFSVARGPLIEHDWYNFEALNIPKDHPSRDMQDTFFVAPQVVLRTHTSNVQIRTMEKRQPPVRILAPGMVFRCDDVDATHSPVFHQIEGLWVDEKVTFADLKGVLHYLVASLFGPDAKVRFRPSFFPFTEPSLEMDMSRSAITGREDDEDWLEILGAGMVDPAVLEAVGYDPDKVQGFAFGLGMDRIAMLRWGINDIRLLYENDLRFLQQFRSSSNGSV